MSSVPSCIRTPYSNSMMTRIRSEDNLLPCPLPIPIHGAGFNGMCIRSTSSCHSPSVMHRPLSQMYPAEMQHLMIRQHSPRYSTSHYPITEICCICLKESNMDDNFIFCGSGCNRFYHGSCVGLTQNAIRLIRGQTFAEWVCDYCHVTKKIPPVKLIS
ncbi:unnamed protein product [Didymodactylos carnosus]|uniref:PHD-type domain-containing protein n=1 Tax=Didymodactylos carnosus TaxID=1234261 RepID=A0A8S2E6T4_9BILA|nr:unnamed protein product [Didymodactylos carnosus]CAF3842989.1 unnamed protein product [Didymodactylos carnosus]